MSRAVLIKVLVLSVLSAQGSRCLAQAYSETERVTVIALPVELRAAARPESAAKKPPDNLTARDFEIVLDGKLQEVAAVDPISASGPLPHHFLIYVEPAFLDGSELQDSMDLIASVAPEMGQSATVDLVIADPDPRYLLQASPDSTALENLLASPNWRDSASDDLRGLRAGFLEALSDTETELDLHSLQNAFALEENRLIQQRLDLLLSFVADHPAPGKQQMLLLVGMQFDLDPMEFYGSWGDDATPARALEDGERPSLEKSAQSLAASLAGLGWITHPLVAPESESPLRPGLQVGKWRVTGPAGGRILGLRMARESERDPELAQGYLENGQALLEQGSAIEAEKAFRLALHHFYGDKRTASEQAQAATGLAAALEAQGRSIKARSTMRMASELDTEVASDNPQALAVLLDPTAGLDILAVETSGRLVFEQQDLESAFVDLKRRLRLSFQVVGDPTGELYTIEARCLRNGLLARVPAWVRFGAPPEVAAARVRLLYDGVGVESPAVLDAQLERRSEEPRVTRLDFRLPAVNGGEESRRDQERACRLTMTLLAEDEPPNIEQQSVACRPVAGALEGSVELSVPAGEELLGVLVEDLATGHWAADIFEIERRHPG